MAQDFSLEDIRDVVQSELTAFENVVHKHVALGTENVAQVVNTAFGAVETKMNDIEDRLIRIEFDILKEQKSEIAKIKERLAELEKQNVA